MAEIESKLNPSMLNPPPEGSIKETIESIIIAFILAFVFRAFVVEAFVIPTGSMAPTLLGQHVTLTCPQCGYQFTVGPYPSYAQHQPDPIQHGNNEQGLLEINCPMCDYHIEQKPRRLEAGDRILVLKYIYGLSEPKRWDVVVFKNPVDPIDNYIKRLVGLPNENLWLVRGNVYTQDLDAQGQPIDPDKWKIQRKTSRPKVQRAVWQPLYHSEYVPLDGGESVAVNGLPVRAGNWHLPWRAETGQKNLWTPRYNGRAYAFAGSAKPSTLKFHYTNDSESKDQYPYNHFMYGGSYGYVVEDVRVAATIEPQDQAAATFQIDTERYQFRATVDSGKDKPIIEVKGKDFADWTTPDDLEYLQTGPLLQPGVGSTIELWHADQNVQLWVNGRLWAQWTYDNEMTTEQLDELSDTAATQSPEISIRVSGSAMTLSDLQVDRDLFYTPVMPENSRVLGSTLNKAHIEHDRFFCLGDNSPASKDSRLWEKVDPWIRYHSRELGHEVEAGYVPREVMIGRAFFVYFPAPHRFEAMHKFGFVPNFGKLRFIH